MKLYVGNLSFESTENDLQDLFEQHGTVNEVHLMMDRFTGKSRGFAFITMNDGAQANAAVSALNGHELNGRALTVNEARPREERPRPHGGGGGGGRQAYVRGFGPPNGLESRPGKILGSSLPGTSTASPSGSILKKSAQTAVP